jgi:hypothetical protein
MWGSGCLRAFQALVMGSSFNGRIPGLQPGDEGSIPSGSTKRLPDAEGRDGDLGGLISLNMRVRFPPPRPTAGSFSGRDGGPTNRSPHLNSSGRRVIGSPPASGAGAWRFESSRPDHCQIVRRRGLTLAFANAKRFESFRRSQIHPPAVVTFRTRSRTSTKGNSRRSCATSRRYFVGRTISAAAVQAVIELTFPGRRRASPHPCDRRRRFRARVLTKEVSELEMNAAGCRPGILRVRKESGFDSRHPRQWLAQWVRAPSHELGCRRFDSCANSNVGRLSCGLRGGCRDPLAGRGVRRGRGRQRAEAS